MLLDEFPLASFSAIYVCGIIIKGYLHRSAISSLEPVVRVFEGCAKAYLGDVDDANVVKLHRFSGKVSYLVCPKFETFPRLRIGLVETPLINWNTRFSSGQPGPGLCIEKHK